MECVLENITIYYEQFGEGIPVIILHGRPVSHEYMVHDFEPIFDQLEGWRRIYPDLPGMGKTKGPSWITSQDRMLDVLMDFIDTLIDGERFCLVGTSYGAYLAQGLISRWNERIDGAFFLVPAMSLPAELSTPPPKPVTLVEDKSLSSKLEGEAAELFEGPVVVQSREMLEYLTTLIIPAYEAADREFLEQLMERYEFSFDVYNLPRPFDKPTLFLMGRQDSWVGYADTWQILEQFPRASFVVLDRAGHGLAVEQKQLFQNLTTEWLTRVKESAGLQ